MTPPEIPMSFEQITKNRFAAKSFDNREIPEEKIEK